MPGSCELYLRALTFKETRYMNTCTVISNKVLVSCSTPRNSSQPPENKHTKQNKNNLKNPLSFISIVYSCVSSHSPLFFLSLFIYFFISTSIFFSFPLLLPSFLPCFLIFRLCFFISSILCCLFVHFCFGRLGCHFFSRQYLFPSTPSQ